MVTLAALHWQETEAYRHGQPFSPSFERYNSYDAAGWHKEFTVRDKGRMVGYAGVYIVPSMHTQQLLCTEDTWFLLPEYRKGRNALNFYKFIEEECIKLGVIEMCMTAPEKNKVNRILEYLGYKLVSFQYSKHLFRADSAHQILPVMENENARIEEEVIE